jgi:hypothetical protein
MEFLCSPLPFRATGNRAMMIAAAGLEVKR